MRQLEPELPFDPYYERPRPGAHMSTFPGRRVLAIEACRYVTWRVVCKRCGIFGLVRLHPIGSRA